MNIVFMGTPDFAVPTLEYLVEEGHNVKCVVTQPDRPKGRGNKLTFSPVKVKAVELNIPVLQPESLRRDREFADLLKNILPDVIIVIAFGQILPQEILSIPKKGCINVHASLLPRLRGAAPINWAIINGDEMAGITTMYMDAGLDTGDMLLKESTPIGPDETAGELHDRLSILGARLLIDTLRTLEKGGLKREPQDNNKSTYAPMLDKDTGRIIWEKSAKDIKNLVRGTNPWPAAYTYLSSAKIKVWSADVEDTVQDGDKPGSVWKIDRKGIHVCTGNSGIIITEVQPENGRRISSYDYTLGHPINIGSFFK